MTSFTFSAHAHARNGSEAIFIYIFCVLLTPFGAFREQNYYYIKIILSAQVSVKVYILNHLFLSSSLMRLNVGLNIWQQGSLLILIC